MNVGQLIKELSKYPEDIMVTVDGYEGGVTESLTVSKIMIHLNTHTGCRYYGEHEPVHNYYNPEDEGDISVINIGRD